MCFLIVVEVRARDGFVKDQTIDLVEFPPKVAIVFITLFCRTS